MTSPLGEARDRDRLGRPLPVWQRLPPRSAGRAVPHEHGTSPTASMVAISARFRPPPSSAGPSPFTPTKTAMAASSGARRRGDDARLPAIPPQPKGDSPCPRSVNSHARPDGYIGPLRTLSFDCELTFVTADNADSENAPAYRVHLGDETRPGGRRGLETLPANGRARLSRSSWTIRHFRFRSAPGCSSRTRTDATGACTGPARKSATSRTERCAASACPQHCGGAALAAALPSFSFPACPSAWSKAAPSSLSRRPPDSSRSAIHSPLILPRRRSAFAFPNTGSSPSWAPRAPAIRAPSHPRARWG